MKISRRLSLRGSLKPRAENLLRGIPAEYLHHEKHEIKHPLTVYQASLFRIETAWLKVIPTLEKLYVEVMCNVEQTQYDPLLEAYEALLYRLNEHIDSCHEVLRSLRAPNSSKKPASSARFLWDTKLPGFKSFVDSIHKTYRDTHLGILVNEMKHSSAQIRAISGRTEHNIILGYYLDGPRAGGALGPNLKLHAKFKHLDTAFSFSRDMMMHFWWIYQASEAMSRCIEQTMHYDHNAKIEEVPPASVSGAWQEVAFTCAQLKAAFFMDECSKPYPLIVCPPDRSFVSLEFPTANRAPDYRTMQINMLLKMAEGTNAFVMPYGQRL